MVILCSHFILSCIFSICCLVKKAQTPKFLFSETRVFKRCLADSNRRKRFCRPVTKPLIQGTIAFLFAVAKVLLFFHLTKFSLPFFCIFLVGCKMCASGFVILTFHVTIFVFSFSAYLIPLALRASTYLWAFLRCSE